ncbi:MAG: DUF2892 domain-containing protein [Bacteroidota bacterium]
MKKNVSKLDRLIRIALALLLALLIISNNILGMWRYAAIVIGLVLFVSAFYGSCPIYLFFNFSSKPKK